MRIETKVSKEVIYRNGAMITRCAEVSSGEWELGPLPLLFQNDSLRLRIGSGQITEMREICDFEQQSQETACDEQALKTLKDEKQRLEAKIVQLNERIELYESFDEAPETSDAPPHKLPSPSSLCDVHSQAAKRLAELDLALAQTQEALAENERQLESAERQRRTKKEHARAYRWIYVKIEGATPGTRIEIDYFVEAARWLPCYALLIEGQTATLRMDAFVAQASGEDWQQSEIHVSSADLSVACTMPELPAWRIGLDSPAARPAYRPLPGDLASLFTDYDLAKTKMASQSEPFMNGGMKPQPMMESMMCAAKACAAPVMQEKRSAKISRAKACGPRACYKAECACEEPCREEEECEAEYMPATPPQASDPAILRHAWLRLSGPDEPNRGKLCPVDPLHHFAALIDHRDVDDLELLRQAISDLEQAGRNLQRLALPSGTRPLRSDDWRAIYSAHGLRDLPGDGQWHRISLYEQPLPVTFHHRVVPRLQKDVFRFCSLTLPGQPLPTGPLALQIDGVFSGNTTLEAQGKPGPILINLGIDPAVRVLDRVVRSQQQDKKSLLSQLSQIDTQIELQLRSGLTESTVLHLFERLPQPAAGQDKLEIELTQAEPQPIEKDRASDGRFVNGGLHFELTLPPGQLVPLSWSYRIRFPAQFELEGGNRRD